jgi:serine/threonine-protein phosphatase 2A activator 2
MSTASAGAKLVEKLRAPRPADTQASAPRAPGPQDPFEGAREPVVIRRPALGPELPRKRIVTERHLEHFATTSVFGEILGMLRRCNDAVCGHKLTDELPQRAPVQALLRIIDEVQTLVRATPRDTASASMSRFGNPAFRTLYQRIVDATDRFQQIIPGLNDTDGDDAAYQARLRQELAVYFYESWGNAKRIDYGSGMELNFYCWLCVSAPVR